MIDISLWRAVIGGWIFKIPIKEKNTYCGGTDQTMDRTMSYGYIKFLYYMYAMYGVYYALLAPFVALLLLCSGDVELNPGPILIKCLSCLKENSIRKLKCSCGQNLRKSSRQITPKVAPTMCSAVKHANMANIRTSSEHVSGCFDRTCDVIVPYSTLQSSIGPTFSTVESTVVTNATTTTTDISQVTISQVDSKTSSYSSFDQNSGCSSNSTDSDKQYFISQPVQSYEHLSAFRNRRSQYKAKSLVDKSKRLYSSQPETVDHKQRYYKANSQKIIQKSSIRYYANRQRILDRYHANSSVCKRKALDRYHANSSVCKRKVLDRYHANSSVCKRKALDRYHANSSVCKRKALDRYHANSSVCKRKALDRYHANSLLLNQQASDRYHSIRSTRKQQVLYNYYANHEANKARKQELYAQKNNRQMDKLIASSISKKYNKMRATSQVNIKTIISKSVDKMPGKSYAEKHLNAEHLVKTSLYLKESFT